jgi:hypothetical protein
LTNKIIIEKEKSEEPLVEEKPREKSRLSSTMQKVADFDFNISNTWLLQQIPFGVFVVALLLLHIWNGHNTERVNSTRK